MEREQQPAGADTAVSLAAIERGRAGAARHGQNNGVVPLVWGVLVFLMLSAFAVLPAATAGITTAVVAAAAALWTAVYARRLPVRPLRVEQPFLFLWWGLYHAAVLFGGVAVINALGGQDAAPRALWVLIGLLDAAPLLVFGLRQWRWAHRPVA